jgi:tRNA(Ile)-lysidine synthase
VGQIVRDHGLWQPGQHVAVAVSGGLDSVVLLDVLLATRAWHEGELSVVTVDHGMRPGSAEDAVFVADLAREGGLRFRSIALALGPDASEDTARTARFAAFDGVPSDVVALAHHRDDQAETVLLHLLRGTGPAGLSGMAVRRGRFVRPLLGEPRDALLAYARHRGLTWREDPSNADPRYLRNRVRHEVLPLLEEVRPGAREALARAARAVAADAEIVEAQLPDEVGPPWPVSWVGTGPAALVRRALLAALPALTATQLDDIVASARRGSGTIDLGSRGTVHISGSQVTLTQC